MRALFALIAVSAALASGVQASPSPFSWRREILLGANEREHVYLVASMTNAGTSYASTESLSLVQRSNTDPRWMQRTTLRVTARTTDPRTGERKDTEAFVADLDLGQFLSERNMHPAFIDALPESIAIDSAGMYDHRGGQRAYFLTAAELAQWTNLDLPQLGMRGENRRVVDLMRVTPDDSARGTVDFFVVRSGAGMNDAGEIQAIVPVSDGAVQAAIQSVQAKLAARKKPASKKR